MYGGKNIVVLANWIVDIELTKFFRCPNKFLVSPTHLFVEPTNEFDIVFCLTKLFVWRAKILMRQKKSLTVLYFSPYGEWNFDIDFF